MPLTPYDTDADPTATTGTARMNLDTSQLRFFRPFSDLDAEQLELIASSSETRECPAGTHILHLGDTQPYSYFLLQGKVELIAADGAKVEIEAESERARNPLADLLPRKYEVVARAPVSYLKVASSMVQAVKSADPEAYSVMIQSLDQPTEMRPAAQVLLKRIRSDLKHDRLQMPSLPEVAVRIGKILHETSTNAKHIADAVALDPAMATKLMRAANSPVYGGVAPVASLSDAVMRLGFQMTHNLVISYALRDLYRSRSRLMLGRMRALWRHSVRVAAICFVLAMITRRFNPDEAMLAGLLHDIGVIPIYTYADAAQEMLEDLSDLDDLTQRLRAPVGAKILETWGFDDKLVTACREADMWQRDGTAKADLADLVLLAQLHSFIGTDEVRKLPAVDQVPAFRKVLGEDMTPKKSLKLMRRAQQRIDTVEQMLHGAAV